MDQTAWLHQRRQGLGASDAAAVFSLSPYKSPLALFYEKRGLADLPPAELEAVEWGKVLERPIGDRYGRETQRGVVWPEPFEITTHPTIKFMQATLDASVTVPAERAGVIMPRDTQGQVLLGPGALECKNAGFFKREEWMSEPPLAFQIQLQHQLAVSGFSWGSIAALVGGNTFVWTDQPRNDHFIEILIARETEFWNRVLEGKAPDVDGTASTKELLHLLFPKVQVVTPIELPLEAVEWDTGRMAAAAARKTAQENYDLYNNKLRHAIGDHVGGVTRQGVLYTLKEVNRVGFSVAPTSYRELRRKGPKDAEPRA